jgi:hypothetical protein
VPLINTLLCSNNLKVSTSTALTIVCMLMKRYSSNQFRYVERISRAFNGSHNCCIDGEHAYMMLFISSYIE